MPSPTAPHPLSATSSGWPDAAEAGQAAARPLQEGQDLVAVCRNYQGVLELRSALAVPGDGGPAIRPEVVGDVAEGEHGLDGECHPLLHDHADVRIIEVRHDQAGMERRTDAMPGEVTDHAVAEPPGIGLDDPANRAQRPARRHSADAAHHRLPGALDQETGLLIYRASQESGVGVPVHAADEGGDVDV